MALVANATLLLSLVYIYDLLNGVRWVSDTWVRQVIIGIAIGGLGVLVMLMPWTFAPGITFDTRSVLLAISGLFFGGVPTVVAVLMTSALRLIQGEGGAWTGVSVIVASAIVGVIWRHAHEHRLTKLSFGTLYLLGLVVHLVMLALMLTLPHSTALRVLGSIALPVIVIYPVATAAYGTLMVNRLRREESAAALGESERSFRALFEQAAIGVSRTDAATGRFVFVNQRFADIVGYSREELLSMDFQSLTHPDDLRQDLDNVDRLARGELREYSMEKRYRRKDGTYVWVNLTVSRLWEEEGHSRHLVGLIEDITDRKQAEEEMRRERAFFDRLVETAAEGIAITGDQGRILRVNAEFVRMFGYSVDEAVGACIDDLVAPPALDDEARSITRTTSQGGEIRLETLRRRKDGSLIDVSLIAAPILIAGKQEAVYAIYLDNTERKRAEEAREKAEGQLHQSQKMEAIGTLAGGVAHDFNNLLTGILGNIALMRSSMLPADPLLENLNEAEASARQAADLTKGLLTFSRSAIVQPAPMNIATAIEASLALLKQSLPTTMDVVRDYGRTAWNVLADQTQITQILFNLAVNARDAMAGRGTLTVRVRNEVVGEEYIRTTPFARQGEFVLLSVTDTGPGIPAEILEHIFEPFHTTKPVGSGTGLGLSIVYGAVKQSGGWITAVSTAGVGTTFNIYLPRCLDEPGQPSPPAAVPVNAGNGTILVVEDEPVVCAVACAFLNRDGYEVLTAPDGASALNVLRQHLTDIALILLDMTMPGMTIDEIVRAIRALDPTVPILLNSGYTSNDAVRQMLAEGSAQGFLGKPYDPGQLLAAVRGILHPVLRADAFKNQP
jgi:two-component system cell cycle sensor histidine kinase/response regulator CckA